MILAIRSGLIQGSRFGEETTEEHEFGHFSQTAGMRLTYIIGSVNAWFARVVYERDAWDEQLIEWSKGTDIRLAIFLWVARFFIWVTRKILRVLMLLGHAISCFMSRQMEFDADRCEIQLAGSDVMASTMRQLKILGVAMHGARSDLGASWQEHRLADDYPALVIANIKQIPEELIKQIEKIEGHEEDEDLIRTIRSEMSRCRKNRMPSSANWNRSTTPSSTTRDAFHYNITRFRVPLA